MKMMMTTTMMMIMMITIMGGVGNFKVRVDASEKLCIKWSFLKEVGMGLG